jgi:HTH-type transcriptional regulator/antitoxin HigA
MTTKAATRSAPRVGARYLVLIRRLPLRRLQSEAELDRAIGVLNELIDRGKLTPGEVDYLDVLGDLIKRYETKHHPMPPVSDVEMLRFLIEARGVTLSTVAKESGVAVSTLSEILAGKRKLNRKHIESLSRYFHVSPSVFMAV